MLISNPCWIWYDKQGDQDERYEKIDVGKVCPDEIVEISLDARDDS